MDSILYWSNSNHGTAHHMVGWFYKTFSSNRTILNLWVQMSDIADKMDWVIPIDRKAGMMKDMPGGMAGAVQVKWESFSGNLYNMNLLLEKEATKIVIKSAGVDFPMLIHETIKGIFLFLQSGAIKKDKKTAEIVKKATSSFMDEAQDFRYGPPALQKLINFVNKFPESNESNELSSKVFYYLAICSYHSAFLFSLSSSSSSRI